MKSIAAWAALFLACTLAHAQDGQRPPRPENASPAPVGGWCDALTGEKKLECLRDERRRREQAGAGAGGLRGSCDGLAGPEKERCVRRGGSLEVETKPGR